MESEQAEVLHQGWLTKSPPLETRKQLFNQSLITPKWRRRWFVLRQGAMPGQFLLHYYTDPQARKLKGVIDLDQCEQVDTGLTYQSGKVSYQFMFDIKTPKRVYYLAADSEAEMTAWVDWVCQVCGLRTFAAEEETETKVYSQPPPGALTIGGRLPSLDSDPVLSQPHPSASLPSHPHCPSTSGISSPYMHLSECFTGGSHPLAARVRDPSAGATSLSRHSPDYQNAPCDLPDSSMTCGDDSVFLPPSPALQRGPPTAASPTPPGGPPTAAFSALALPTDPPPSAPGRPPKPPSLRLSKDVGEVAENLEDSQALLDHDKDQEANNNLLPAAQPPCVDRRLKPERSPASLTLGPPVQRNRKPPGDLVGAGTFPGPRGSSTGVPYGMVIPGNSESDEGSNSPGFGSRRNSLDEQIYFYMPSLQQSGGTFMIPCEPVLDHCVQYLDLDLSAPASSTAAPKKEEEHPSTVYKTVDFIKTEAFNRTRQKVEEYKYNIKPEQK